MPSGQVIVNNTLTILGILEQGGIPSATDSAAALAELNTQWDAWGIDEGLIYAVTQFTGGALVTTQGSYPIGIGAPGAFNVVRPSRIYSAYVAVTGNRNELKIVNGTDFYKHNDLTASAVTPDELYPDFNVDPVTGLMTLNLWPIPTFTGISPTLNMEIAVPFKVWTLGTVTILPYGYQDAIQYALAWRLIPQYGGVVAPQVMETVSDLGQKAELRIRTMNAANRMIPPQAAALQPLTPQQAAPAAR